MKFQQLKLNVLLLGRSLFYLNRTDLICQTFCGFSFVFLFYGVIMIRSYTKYCLLSCASSVTTVTFSFFSLQKRMAKPFIQHMKKNSNLWHCTSRFCWDLTTLTHALKLDSLMCWGMIEGKRAGDLVGLNSAFSVWRKHHSVSAIRRKVCGLHQCVCVVVKSEGPLQIHLRNMSHCLVKELAEYYWGF